MTFKLFGSKGHHKSHKSHKSHQKQHNKEAHRRHESPVEQRKESYASERHIDAPRVCARKLLMSIMNECAEGKDDDSFDAPPMERRDAKARNVVAPESFPSYTKVAGAKSIDTDDDLKPMQLRMGDDSVLGDSSEAPSMISLSSGGPPKEIFQDTSKDAELENESSPMAKRFSQNEGDGSRRREEFQNRLAKLKIPNDHDEDELMRESPAEKERRNIYDMEWFAKVENAMKKSYSDLDDGTPTTHDDSLDSQPEALPGAPLFSESDDIDSTQGNEMRAQTPECSDRKTKIRESFSSPANDGIYRQQSFKGAIATSYSDLFESAFTTKPVFEGIMKTIFDHICMGKEDGMITRFADIKDRDRAKEKASGLYSRRTPGPAVSWLYDIVRGSVLFAAPDAPMRCIEAFQLHPDVHVVNIRNKFESDGLDGYELLNLHLQIDTKKGFLHVCEMQIHYLDIDTFDLEQLDDGMLNELLENRLTIAQLERLSYLFSDQLCRYDWAEVVLRKLLKLQLGEADSGRLGCGKLHAAETYGRIGSLLHRQLDRPSEAVEILEKELDILQQQLGISDMKVAESNAQIGDILHAQGETELALEYYGKAVEILQLQQDQKGYSWVKSTREDISSLMSSEEEVRESLEMYSKSLDKYKMTIDEGLSNLHDAFEEMHNQSSSEKSLDQVIMKNNESIDRCQKTLQEYNPHHQSLGETTKEQGAIDEIFEVYAKSLIQSYHIRKLQQGGAVEAQAE